LSPGEGERQTRLERTGWNITNSKTTKKGAEASPMQKIIHEWHERVE
jgi:hypothetical protein